MATVSSPQGVCNLSLDLLKAGEQVTSLLTPETDTEGLCSRWYDPTRLSLLRMFPWNFARKRKTISREAVAPEFGYSDAYKLPGDFVGIVFIGEDILDPLNKDYVIEGGQLLIDNDGAPSINICYIWNIETVTKFDPIFLMFLVGELGVVLGNSITGLNKSLKAMEGFRDRWEMKARAKNGQENKPRVISESPLLKSRNKYRSANSSDGQHLF